VSRRDAGRIFEGGINNIGEDLRGIRETAPLPILYRTIVVDVISDPLLLTELKKVELREILSSDILLDTLPRNSIIGRHVRRNGEFISSAKLFYPFFSPHLSLPVKAGEHVWIIYENPEEIEDQGFWISRIHEQRNVDDVNYTHADRKWLPQNNLTLTQIAGGIIPDPIPSFPNGDGTPQTFSLPHTTEDTIKNAGKEYDDLVLAATSRLIETREPVPRLTKRPGDTILQGSNNTAIILGEDRTNTIGDDVIGKPLTDVLEGAGTIDLVTGRGTIIPTAPETILNTRQELETDKNTKITIKKDENRQEGDIDLINDKSRLYLSMNTRADQNFQIELAGLSDTSDIESAAAAIKSDQVRIIARKDIKILVTSEGGDLTNACSITFKNDGNIVMIPGEKSVIKMGSDSADKALVCTNTPAQVVDGKVVGVPVKTTMGGVISNDVPGFGKFANKILVD